MGVARSSSYAAPETADADAALVIKMREITDVWECYGYRRVGAELRHRGWVVNAKKVRRLMKRMRRPRPIDFCGSGAVIQQRVSF